MDELSTYYATGVGKLETFEVDIRVNIKCMYHLREGSIYIQCILFIFYNESQARDI